MANKKPNLTFKKLQEIVKMLRRKNPELKHKEAVKKTTVHAPGTLGEFSHKSLPKSQTRSELSSSPSRPIIPTLDLSSTQSQVLLVQHERMDFDGAARLSASADLSGFLL